MSHSMSLAKMECANLALLSFAVAPSVTPAEEPRDLIECVARAAKDGADFVTDQFFNLRPGGTEVFARIEFFGIVGESFPDGRSHRQPEVGIDVHLGAAEPAGDLDVSFRNAGRFSA